MSTITTGAEAVEWNLADLYAGPDDPRIESELEETHAAAKAFRERYRGKLGELSAAELNDAVVEVERIESTSTRVETYARLRSGRRQHPTSRAARSCSACASGTRRSKPSCSSSTSSGARSTTTSPSGCSPTRRSSTTPTSCARSAATSRTQLSEPEEKIVGREERHRRQRLGRLFNELVADLQRRARRRRPLARRGAREARARDRPGASAAAVAEAVTEALAPGRAHARLRPQHDPERARDRGPAARLHALDLGAQPRQRDLRRGGRRAWSTRSTSRYDIPQRFYALKARLLGLDTLYDYDRFAPLTARSAARSRGTRRGSTCSTRSTSFDPRAGEIVGGFFERATGSTPPAARARCCGAFCATTVPDVHPYVLMNYAGERRSVLTLAHELGHGLHGVARPATRAAERAHAADARRDRVGLRRGAHLREACWSARTIRARLLAARRPDRGHARDRLPPDRDQPLRGRDPHRPPRGAASSRVERIAELWAETQRRMLGDAVEVTRRLPHLVELHPALHPGAGLRLRVLVRLPLLARDLPALRRGGRRRSSSRTSTCCAQAARRRRASWRPRVGFDIEDPGFWSAGLDAIVRARRRGRAARRSARLTMLLVVAATERELAAGRRRADGRLRDRAGRGGGGDGAGARRGAADRRPPRRHRRRPRDRAAHARDRLGGGLLRRRPAPFVAALRCPDAGLLAAAARARFPERAVLPDRDERPRRRHARSCDVEAMEGFAVLRACELAGVPGGRGARRLERDRRAGPGAAGASTRRSRRSPRRCRGSSR